MYIAGSEEEVHGEPNERHDSRGSDQNGCAQGQDNGSFDDVESERFESSSAIRLEIVLFACQCKSTRH